MATIVPAILRNDPDTISSAAISLPNTADGRVQASQSTSLDSSEYLGKADYLLNTKHRIAFTTFNVTQFAAERGTP